MQIESLATPLLALVCDGAYYDVATLEARAGSALAWPADFRSRVLGLGCAGLRELDARIRSGFRPAEARLARGSYLPLAPCDTELAHHFQMAPYGLVSQEPQFRLRDGRRLLGDAQYVVVPGPCAVAEVEPALAIVLGEDLRRAPAAEASRAILGFSLSLDWSAWAEANEWPARQQAFDGCTQLGPTLVPKEDVADLSRIEAQLTLEGVTHSLGRLGDWAFSLAECLSFASYHLELRAGDVVTAGRLGGRGATRRFRVPAQSPVSLAVAGLGELSGRALVGPPLGPWRELPGHV